MLNAFRGSLRIGLSRTGITLLKTSRWRQPHTALLSDNPFSEELAAVPDRLAAQLRNVLTAANCSNLTTTIILANDWVRLFMVTPPQNTGHLQDCRAAAAMRFQALYGESINDWKLEADWGAQHPFLACAIPQPLLNALHQVAIEHRLKLIEVAPQFIVAWNRWHHKFKSNAWFGLVHDEVLTLGVVEQQRLCALRATPIPAGAWKNKQWLLEHLTREALRLNLLLPSHIQLCGNLPGHWVTQTMGSLTCTRLDAGHHTLGNGSVSAGVMLARTWRQQ